MNVTYSSGLCFDFPCISNSHSPIFIHVLPSAWTTFSPVTMVPAHNFKSPVVFICPAYSLTSGHSLSLRFLFRTTYFLLCSTTSVRCTRGMTHWRRFFVLCFHLRVAGTVNYCCIFIAGLNCTRCPYTTGSRPCSPCCSSAGSTAWGLVVYCWAVIVLRQGLLRDKRGVCNKGCRQRS